jgi:hypothetical protein
MFSVLFALVIFQVGSSFIPLGLTLDCDLPAYGFVHTRDHRHPPFLNLLRLGFVNVLHMYLNLGPPERCLLSN